MKQEVYRYAYNEANSELSEIITEFEQLRLRKENIEKALDALRPFAGVDAQAASAQVAPSASNNSVPQLVGASPYAY
ncbi:MAG: hypothetical protein KGM96_08600 [Acidobacteriota bacterium]|nr:hypothetical protein [Acidobacteriota bacterium]